MLLERSLPFLPFEERCRSRQVFPCCQNIDLLSASVLTVSRLSNNVNKPQRVVKYRGIEPLSTILSWLEQHQNQLHTSCNDIDASMSSRLASEKQDSAIPRLSTELPVEWWANQLSVNIADKATGEAIWLRAIALGHDEIPKRHWLASYRWIV